MSLRLRLLSVGALLVLFTYLTVANFIPKEVRLANPLLPNGGVILGLDLQGGIHWVVGVDLPDRSVGAQTGQEKRHAGSHIGACQYLAVELRRPDDHSAMRIAKDNLRSHFDETVDPVHPRLEHFFKEQNGSP